MDHLFVFGRTVLLTVLLLPKDFGFFGTAFLTLVVLDTLSNTGFYQTLIQKEEDISLYLETAQTVQTDRPGIASCSHSLNKRRYYGLFLQ